MNSRRVVAAKRWLISWLGASDLESAEARRGSDIGPVAMALIGDKRYDRVYLLTNYDFERSKVYCSWLKSRSNYDWSVIDLYRVDLASPIDYADIYTQVSSHLQKAGLPRGDVELTFHVIFSSTWPATSFQNIYNAAVSGSGDCLMQPNSQHQNLTRSFIKVRWLPAK